VESWNYFAPAPDLIRMIYSEEDFLHNIDIVEAAFGNYAFRRWVPEKSRWRQQILAALFDAEMFACRGLSEDILREKQSEVIGNIQ